MLLKSRLALHLNVIALLSCSLLSSMLSSLPWAKHGARNKGEFGNKCDKLCPLGACHLDLNHLTQKPPLG